MKINFKQVNDESDDASLFDKALERMKESTIVRLTDKWGFPDTYFVKHPSGKWYHVNIDEDSWTVTKNYGEVSDKTVAETMVQFKKNGGVDTRNEEIYDPSMHGHYFKPKKFDKKMDLAKKLDLGFKRML